MTWRVDCLQGRLRLPAVRKMITHQQLFNIYSVAVVGVAGNAVLGWELGKKGLIRLGLEGPSNRRVRTAVSAFIAMLVWQRLGKLSTPFQTAWDAWPVLIGLGALLIARGLIPRSQRLYDRAKFLTETADVGKWRGVRSESETASARNHPNLIEAERLYLESSQIQARLLSESEDVRIRCDHQRNMAVVDCQLSLVYLMQARLIEGKQAALNAISIAEALSRNEMANRANSALLSEALFRAGECEYLLGQRSTAETLLNRALAIDESLGDTAGAHHTKMLLDELKRTST